MKIKSACLCWSESDPLNVQVLKAPCGYPMSQLELDHDVGASELQFREMETAYQVEFILCHALRLIHSGKCNPAAVITAINGIKEVREAFFRHLNASLP